MEKKYCYEYPHPAVTCDCIVFSEVDDRLHVLLIQRGNEPFKGCWAFPGGFMEIDETAETCAVRELQEETGLVVEEKDIVQFHTFSNVNRDPRERIVTVTFYTVQPYCEASGGDDAACARWFPVDEVPNLAFDHDLMLRMALEHKSKN